MSELVYLAQAQRTRPLYTRDARVLMKAAARNKEGEMMINMTEKEIEAIFEIEFEIEKTSITDAGFKEYTIDADAEKMYQYVEKYLNENLQWKWTNREKTRGRFNWGYDDEILEENNMHNVETIEFYPVSGKVKTDMILTNND